MLGFVMGAIAVCLMAQSALALSPSPYTYKKPSFDGIGKVYMGREIAEVMGHQGADWLERDSRDLEEDPQLLVDSLGLKPTDVVADIGAGTGHISLLIAPVIPQGKVLAVDVQPEMIEMLGDRIAQTRQTNIEPIQGTEEDPNLPPNSIDLAILVDAYHEFTYPREMMLGIVQSLKPNGRVALVEYRAKDPFVFIKPHHKMTQAQVRKEMASVGLTWQETNATLPQQHLMIFTRST
ncbi:MAG: methyltransferase domain-containing protein [Acaryochloridaceae cyanobacterium RU_4_10]|nr:methyltransferase domain-containing protein [Acaryochloridaceae cyanobacterium RU_4_10]